MQKYLLVGGLIAAASAQTTTTTTDGALSTTTSLNSSPIASPSPICGVAGYDLQNPPASAYDGSGSYGAFDTCKSYCAKYNSFAFGNGACLCYPLPVSGNLNPVSSSPYTYYDMSCPAPPAQSSSTTTLSSTVTEVPTISPSTASSTAITMTSSSDAMSGTTSSSTISSTTQAVDTSTSATSVTSAITTTTTTSITTTTTTTVRVTSASTTSLPTTTTTVPTTLTTKTTTTTSRTTTSTTPVATTTSPCFKIRANNQYLTLATSRTSLLSYSAQSSSVSTFYIDRLGYIKVAADNYILMRTLTSIMNLSNGYISRIGLLALSAVKTSSSKTLTLSSWWPGAAQVWTSSADTAIRFGGYPGSGWTQIVLSYEEATCPTTAFI